MWCFTPSVEMKCPCCNWELVFWRWWSFQIDLWKKNSHICTFQHAWNNQQPSFNNLYKVARVSKLHKSGVRLVFLTLVKQIMENLTAYERFAYYYLKIFFRYDAWMSDFRLAVLLIFHFRLAFKRYKNDLFDFWFPWSWKY